METLKVHFVTFGCKVNIYETGVLRSLFEENCYTAVDSPDDAHVIVINSCTVTQTADRKLRRTAVSLKNRFPDKVLCITGCYPQAHEEIPFPADVVTGNKDRGRLISAVNAYMQNRERVSDVSPHCRGDSFEGALINGERDHTRAFMKIQDGCDMHCTYCIIPAARGHVRSSSIEDIRAQAQLFAANGCKEIVLVGIDLAFYGLKEGLRLSDAVHAVCETEGIERVRLGSLEPEMISPSDLDALAMEQKLCPSFHLSLQSGSDKVLKAMGRRYDTALFARLTEELRARFHGCGITADMMAGFPGESEEDHRTSLQFAKEMGFSHIHVFPYSERPGTPAAAMPQLLPEIRQSRAAELQSLSDRLERHFLESHTGKVMPVLFEREHEDGIHHGYTPTYAHVKLLTKYSTDNAQKSLRNQIFYVRIEGVEKNSLLGSAEDGYPENDPCSLL